MRDSDWESIRPHLPIGQYGPYPEHLRDQLEGIIWRFGTGSPWRDVDDAMLCGPLVTVLLRDDQRAALDDGPYPSAPARSETRPRGLGRLIE
ncbi:transposase [Streptomyces sp. NPDC002730]|uniref:transposase n=1 Tax=Streptomyces sp. NPDC002730 TaxID=3364662 RepID=UPI0036BDB7C7